MPKKKKYPPKRSLSFRCAMLTLVTCLGLATASCTASDEVSASSIKPTFDFMAEELGYYYQSEAIQAVDTVEVDGVAKPRRTDLQRRTFLLEMRATQDALNAAIDTSKQ